MGAIASGFGVGTSLTSTTGTTCSPTPTRLPVSLDSRQPTASAFRRGSDAVSEHSPQQASATQTVIPGYGPPMRGHPLRAAPTDTKVLATPSFNSIRPASG